MAAADERAMRLIERNARKASQQDMHQVHSSSNERVKSKKKPTVSQGDSGQTSKLIDVGDNDDESPSKNDDESDDDSAGQIDYDSDDDIGKQMRIGDKMKKSTNQESASNHNQMSLFLNSSDDDDSVAADEFDSKMNYEDEESAEDELKAMDDELFQLEIKLKELIVEEGSDENRVKQIKDTIRRTTILTKRRGDLDALDQAKRAREKSDRAMAGARAHARQLERDRRKRRKKSSNSHTNKQSKVIDLTGSRQVTISHPNKNRMYSPPSFLTSYRMMPESKVPDTLDRIIATTDINTSTRLNQSMSNSKNLPFVPLNFPFPSLRSDFDDWYIRVHEWKRNHNVSDEVAKSHIISTCLLIGSSQFGMYTDINEMSYEKFIEYLFIRFGGESSLSFRITEIDRFKIFQNEDPIQTHDRFMGLVRRYVFALKLTKFNKTNLDIYRLFNESKLTRILIRSLNGSVYEECNRKGYTKLHQVSDCIEFWQARLNEDRAISRQKKMHCGYCETDTHDTLDCRSLPRDRKRSLPNEFRGNSNNKSRRKNNFKGRDNSNSSSGYHSRRNNGSRGSHRGRGRWRGRGQGRGRGRGCISAKAAAARHGGAGVVKEAESSPVVAR